MKVAVIGAGYGDESKGSTVAFLCSLFDNPIVYRFSGGHQAGHTVIHNGIKHVFSSFGSGTLQGIPTYWSENCTFYPLAFLNELNVLKEKGITPKIYVNSKCPVTTPCDVHYNKTMNKKNHHGSCGVGFGATLEREEKYYSLLVEDLMFPSVLEEKLNQIIKYYVETWESPYTYIEPNNFIEDCIEALSHIEIVEDFRLIETSFDSVIYEGSQGLLLDKDIGFFPHVTRANVGTKAINDEIDLTFYVTRAYQTRHGNGPMTNENIGHNIEVNPNETNVENYQGTFRRSLLDLDLLKYSIYKDKCRSPMSLVITCLDHIQNDFRLTYKGEIYSFLNEDEFIKKIVDIVGINDVYISKSDRFMDIKKWN